MNRVETNLTEYLPTWFRDILEFQALCQTESKQFEALAEAMEAVANNFFFQTMDVTAISQWEQIFGIVPSPAETVSFRQARLLNRISTRPPFTLGFLYERLDNLIGKNEYTVTVDYPNYTIYVESSAENQDYATEIAVTINTIKPCHMVYINRPYLAPGVLVSEEIDLTQTIYNYKLGSWGLGLSPFTSDQQIGVIKMPAQPSIQAAMLNDIAGFSVSDVASARINGSIVISSLTTSTSGNQGTILYTVEETQASVVTLVELLDSGGTVLTSSGVYVPITGSAQFKHIFTIQEGYNGQ